MFGLPGAGFTDISLSGILSRPWSRFSSLPPEVDVPLPLGFDPFEAPLVAPGAALGLAELAAGSPAVEPRPLGPPLWAKATEQPATTAIMTIATRFISKLPGCGHLIPLNECCSCHHVPRNASVAQPSMVRGNHHKFISFSDSAWSFAMLKDNGFLVVVAIACLALMGIGGIIAHVAN
jgi:hypothetical protein